MRAYTIRGYLSFLFGLSAIIALFAQLFGFESVFVDWTGTVLIWAFSSLVIAALYLMRPQTRPVVVTIALACIFFIQVRLVSFAVLPSEAIGFLGIEPFTAREVSRTLALLIVGTAALLAGIEVAAAMLPRCPYNQEPGLRKNFPAVGMVCLWMISGAVNISIVGYVEGGNGELPPFLGWLARFFEVDVALLITVVWVTVYPPQRRSIVALAWALIAMGLVLSIVGGSRGGAVRIASLILMAAALLPHAKFSIVRAVAFISLVVLLSVGTAMSGHVIRLANATGQYLGSGAVNEMIYDVMRQDIYSRAEQPTNTGGDIRDYAVKITYALNPILVRIGNFDYMALVLNRAGDETVLDTYIRSPYAILRIINGLVPGQIFSETKLSTAQIINVAYRDYTVQDAKDSYFSEPWTIWGLAGVMFGPLGAPLFLFGYGVSLQLGFFAVAARLPTPFRGVVQLIYLFGFVYAGTLMLGIDHTILPMVHYAFAAVSAFATIYGSNALLGLLKSKPKP